MKEKVKEFFYACLFIVILAFIFFFIIWYGTSDKVWYANKHDSNCESMLYDKEDCGCYDRFMNKK